MPQRSCGSPSRTDSDSRKNLNGSLRAPVFYYKLYHTKVKLANELTKVRKRLLFTVAISLWGFCSLTVQGLKHSANA